MVVSEGKSEEKERPVKVFGGLLYEGERGVYGVVDTPLIRTVSFDYVHRAEEGVDRLP